VGKLEDKAEGEMEKRAAKKTGKMRKGT